MQVLCLYASMMVSGRGLRADLQGRVRIRLEQAMPEKQAMHMQEKCSCSIEGGKVAPCMASAV